MTKRIVVLVVVLMLAVVGASADTLHGYCVPPASPCIDNGTITPTGANPPYFAFSFSGNANKNGSGDFWLIDLVPDNHNSGFSLTLNGTNTANSPVTGSLFSATEWNSAFLSAYVSTFNFGNPSHPLDAYLPSTQGVDPGANGYFVYLFNFGAVNYATNPDPTFSVNSGAVPQGSIFLAMLTQTGTRNVTVDTPNSASILATGSPVPEPSSLLMLASGLLGAVGVLRRR